jgi:hypothetical protein
MIDILRIVTHIEPAGERLFSHHLGAVVILSLAWSGLVSLVVECISEVCSTLLLLKVWFGLVCFLQGWYPFLALL